MENLKRGWRWFRGRSTRFQAISWIVVAVLGLAAIGATGSDDSSGATTVATTKPASSPAPSTDPANGDATPSQPVDTGRMSDGEYDQFTGAVQDLGDEESDFGSQLGSKCRVEMTAMQFADASDCIHEAWSGTYDKGLIVYSTIDALKDDVGKGCRSSLLAYQHALDRFVSSQDAAVKAGENLQFGRFAALVKATTPLAKAYKRTNLRVLVECAPS